MTPENALFERLTDYLTHRMPEPERLAFEAELARNPALRQALDEERTLRAGVRAAAVRRKFSTIHAELLREGTIQPAENLRQSDPGLLPTDTLPPAAHSEARVRPLWFGLPGWQVAASLTLLALIGAGLYTWRNAQPSISPLANQQPRPRPSKPAPKTVPEAPIPLEPTAPVARNQPKRLPKQAPISTPDAELYSNFQQLTARISIDRELAQLTTDELTRSEPTRGERSEVDELAEGRRLLKAGNSKAAIEVLLPLVNSPAGGEWAESAAWYLAGAYLKAGQLTEGQALLQKIAQTNTHPQQAVARQLLSRKK